MHPLLEQHKREIADLCREYGVVRLDVFGSITTSAFDPSTSDVDFWVEYGPDVDLGPWVTRHFELKDRLSQVLGMPVDLIMAHEHRNPYIRRSISESRMPLYAA